MKTEDNQRPDTGDTKKPDAPANWKPIGALARALVEKAAKAVAGE